MKRWNWKSANVQRIKKEQVVLKLNHLKGENVWYEPYEDGNVKAPMFGERKKNSWC